MSADFSDEVRDLMQRLDRALPPQDQPGDAADSGLQDRDRLVETAQRLAEAPRVALIPAAQDRIEARLRARVAELHGAERPAPSPETLRPPATFAQPARAAMGRAWRGARGGWRTLAAALLLVIVGGLVGAARVSAASLPGEPLYPLKRAIEGARLALASGDSEVGLRLDAEERIGEFEALLADGRVYVPALTDAADDLGTVADLLVGGHGDPAGAQLRVDQLLAREAALLAQAEPLASEAEWARLQTRAAASAAAQSRIEALIVPSPPATPIVPAPTPAPTNAPMALPTLTPASTATPRPTFTGIPTGTPSITPTSTPTGTPTPTLPPKTPPSGDQEASGMPTRTPPGHGPTPGLGQNAPGQGGANPGVGNEGSPPGQQKSNDGSSGNNKHGG